MMHGRLTWLTRRSKIIADPRTRYFYLQIGILSVLVELIECPPASQHQIDVRSREKVANEVERLMVA